MIMRAETLQPESLQLDAQGRLCHLLTLDGLPVDVMQALLERAQALADGASPHVNNNSFLASFYFEPSTRTRISFEVAANRLGWKSLLLTPSDSSFRKGESLTDTITTLAALGIDAVCIRHSDPSVATSAAKAARDSMAIINGGGGAADHPTQGLLDALTIRQLKPDWSKLRIAIIGDVRHSRVAKSDIKAFTALGAHQIRLAGPEYLLPDKAPENCELVSNLRSAIAGADVVIALRIQTERLQDSAALDVAAYRRDWCLTEHNLEVAKPECIVMHPGPMNRSVEIDDAVADGTRSRILAQVTNGVYLRMAVLEALTSHH